MTTPTDRPNRQPPAKRGLRVFGAAPLLFALVALLPQAVSRTAAAAAAVEGVAPSRSAPTSPTRVCFIFTGSRRSELESCGCHTNQNGGVDREAYIYGQLRKKYHNLIPMEVGAWTDPFQTPNERLKTDYLVRALHAMRFKVYNVTPYDIAFGTTYPRQLVEGIGGHLISANLAIVRRGSAGTTETVAPFAPYAIIEIPRREGGRPIRVGVIGVTDEASLEQATLRRLKNLSKAMPDFVLSDVAAALRKYVPEVREKADCVIVLAYMRRNTASTIPSQVPGIDLLVTSWGYQMTRLFMHPGRTTLITTGYQGRYFAQAVVEFDGENRLVRVTGKVMDIPSKGETVAELTELLAQYRKETKNLERHLAVERQKSRYAGRTQCLACHRKEYLQWTQTPHNMAFATLISKHQHFNPDCLQCHVTAYGEPDGFVDTMQTGHLAAVQCEVCHGPGRAHAQALIKMLKPNALGPTKKLPPGADYPHLVATPPESLCKKCHIPDHDPSFDYKRDLPLVSHKNANGPFRRPRKEKAPIYRKMEQGRPRSIRIR